MLRASVTPARCQNLSVRKVQQTPCYCGYSFPLHACTFFPLLDISPTAQGVDHRRVQKELGDVVVNMHNPVVISSTSVQVTWTVSGPQADHVELNFRTVLWICWCTRGGFLGPNSWCSISFESFELMVNQE